MSEIVDFDSFLSAARASDEAQRLLFVFVKAELPEEASEAEQAQFEAGHGGALLPKLYVDKAPDEVEGFAALAEESEAMDPDWHIVLAAALVGPEGRPPSQAEVDEAFNGIIRTIHAGGDLSRFLAFDRGGDPVMFH